MVGAMLYVHGLIILLALVTTTVIDPRAEAPVFVTLTLLAGAAYLAALHELGRRRTRSRTGLAVCLLLAGLWRVALLAAPPALSDDVYRYVWDGRAQHHGLNPYVTVPADPAVAAVHTPVTRRMDHQHLPSIYPPVAQAYFRLVTGLHDSALAFKAAALVCDLLVMLLLAALLRAARVSAWWMLAWAWNPLVALEGAGNGHVDLLGVLWLVTAALALQRGRPMLCTIAFALAVGTKFLPVVLAPLLAGRVRIRHLLAGAAVFAVSYVPFAGAGLPVGSLGAYLDAWRFNAPFFGWLERFLPGRLAPAAAAAAGLATAAWLRRRDPLARTPEREGHAPGDLPPFRPEAWAWPMAVALLLAPVVYPWYLLWLAPFLWTAGTVPLAVWTVAILSTYLVWESVRTGAGWILPVWVLWVQYGAVVLAAGWALAGMRRRAAGLR